MKSIDLSKTVFFILFLIGIFILYYKKVLSVNNDGNKLLKGLKHLFALFVLMGLLSLFSTIKSVTGQFVILLCILFIINIFNINYSINKCNFPTLYKVNLFGRSSFIILIIALLLYYSYSGNLFRFLYSESELDSATTKKTVSVIEEKLKKKIELPKYCPDMDSDDYKDILTDDGEKWNNLDPKKQKKCKAVYSEKNRRDDIDKKIYA